MGWVWQLLIGLAVLIGLGYWLRGYWKPVRRAYHRARSLYQTARRVRTEFETVRSGRSSRQDRDARVVEVKPRATPTAETGVVCPVCNDRLNDAQLRALRARSVRCPGSSRVGRACPYYGERELN